MQWFQVVNEEKKGEIRLEIFYRPLEEGEEAKPIEPEGKLANISNHRLGEDDDLRNREKGETYPPLKGSVFPPTDYVYPADSKKLPAEVIIFTGIC